MPTTHRLRVSDADRQQIVAALQRHAADGRLTLDEYADRVDQVLLARTYAELAVTMADLPDEPSVDPAADSRATRHLLIAFLVALVTLAIIGAAVAAFR